uniref:Uncharacterized protein n=1 Tax=Rhizophora mucronata TaxID=61149 RepID=A0A2P2R095_RHIMU
MLLSSYCFCTSFPLPFSQKTYLNLWVCFMYAVGTIKWRYLFKKLIFLLFRTEIVISSG